MKIFYLILSLSILFQTIYCDEKTELEPEEESDTESSSTPTKKIIFTIPKEPKNHFLWYFKGKNDINDVWILSESKKDGVEENIAKYDGVWSVEVPPSSAIEEDYALVLKSKARHAALSAKLQNLFEFTVSKQFVVQYEVKFQNGQDCGGAYIKLLTDSPELDLKKFHDKSLYTIMFGPDKCGNDNKLHFIFQHKNPVSGNYEEKHAKKPNSEIDRFFTDKKTHLYTLVVNSDNTFEIYVDQTLVNSGSLLKDFEPPVNPPKEVDDPEDKKPEDWDDRAKIPDPTATKPDDWDESAPEYIEDTKAVKPDGWLDDEPLTVPDEKATKPSDWDEEMDGEWEPPRVDNPKCKDAPGCGQWKPPKIKNPSYKGKWSPSLIDNPKYKGVWSPKKVPNPNYFEDANPYTTLASISSIGLELWSMSDDIAFDNFIITDSKSAADDFATQTWVIKKDAERKADPNAQSVVDAIREATSERPWLWIVIALVIGLPVILLIVYCCRTGSSSDLPEEYRRKMQEELHKKDDDIVVEDDEEDDEAGNDNEGGGDNDGLAENDLTATSTGVGESGDIKKSELESGDEEVVDDDNKRTGSPSQSSGNSTGNSPSQGQSARKRRARKE